MALAFPPNPNVGDVFLNWVWDGDMWVRSGGGGGAGVETLAQLSDVQLSAPAANEILGYDGSEWINMLAPSGGGGGALATLSDVTLTSPGVGQTLAWDGTAWINFTPSTIYQLSAVAPLSFALGPPQGPMGISNTIQLAAGTTAGDVLTWTGAVWHAAQPTGGGGGAGAWPIAGSVGTGPTWTARVNPSSTQTWELSAPAGVPVSSWPGFYMGAAASFGSLDLGIQGTIPGVLNLNSSASSGANINWFGNVAGGPLWATGLASVNAQTWRMISVNPSNFSLTMNAASGGMALGGPFTCGALMAARISSPGNVSYDNSGMQSMPGSNVYFNCDVMSGSDFFVDLSTAVWDVTYDETNNPSPASGVVIVLQNLSNANNASPQLGRQLRIYIMQSQFGGLVMSVWFDTDSQRVPVMRWINPPGPYIAPNTGGVMDLVNVWTWYAGGQEPVIFQWLSGYATV